MSDNENSPKDGSIMVMGRRIPAADVKHLMQFYNADQKLTTDDRKILAEDVGYARFSTLMWTLVDSSMALFAPTALQRVREKRAGFKPPEGLKRPLLHRPLFSAVVATGVSLLSYYYHANTYKEYRIAILSDESKSTGVNQDVRASKQRMLDVWRALDPTRYTLFAFYFYETAHNPDFIIKNPMALAEKEPHEVHFLPPPSSKLGFPGTSDREKVPEANGAHWEKLREANGFARLSSTTPTSDDPVENDDDNVFGLNDTEEKSSEGEKKVSAWERLRKGN